MSEEANTEENTRLFQIWEGTQRLNREVQVLQAQNDNLRDLMFAGIILLGIIYLIRHARS